MLDGGLVIINLVGVMIAIFVGTNEMARELKSGNSEALLSKPVGRDQFLLGKFLGTLYIAFINLVILTVGMLIILQMREGVTTNVYIIQSVLLIAFEVMIMAAVALLLAIVLPVEYHRCNKPLLVSLRGLNQKVKLIIFIDLYLSFLLFLSKT